MTNKILLNLSFAIALVFSIAALPHDKQPPFQATQVKTLRVGVYNFKPLVFMDENGNAQGLYIDVLNHIAKQENWQIEYVACKWADCLAAVMSGELDILPSVGYTEERAQKLDYTQEFLFLDWGMIYRNKGQSIETVLDLEGRRIAALKGSIYTEGLNKLLEQFDIHAQIIEKNEYTEVLAAVNSGKADAGVITRVYGLELEENYANIRQTDVFFAPVKIYFALPKGRDPELLAALNKHLTALKADENSYYHQSFRKWMNLDQESAALPQWVTWSLLGLGALLVTTLLFSLMLRRQVAARTKLLEIEILERERAEKDYRALFERAPVGIFRSTADGRFMKVNRAMAGMYGYAVPEEMLEDIQSIAAQLYTEPDLRQEFSRMLAESGEITNFESLDRRKDGSTFWTSMNARLVNDDAGGVLYYEGFVVDITKRKQTEQALRASEARLHVIFEHANDAMHIDNAEDEIIEVNSRMCELLGYSREELLKMKVGDLQAPEFKMSGNIIQSEMAKYGNSLFEGLDMHRDGRRIPVEISVSRIESPQGDLYVSILRDITERKHAEEALHLAAQDLREAQATARIGNWKWDIKKEEVTWSDEMYRIFGIDKNSYTGRLGDVIAKVIHPDDLHLVLPSNAPALAEKKPIEYRIILPDGSLRHIWAKSGDAMLDDEGKPIFLTGIAQDITERKQAEEALLQANESLAFAQRAAGAGIWDWDMVTGKLSWSPEFFRLFGLDPADVDATFDTWRAALHPDDLQRAEQRINESIRDHVPLFNEYRIVTPSGDARWIGAWGDTTYNERGEALRMSGVCIDLTERKQTETALRESEANLSALIENTDGSIWAVDSHYGLIVGNEEFHRNTSPALGRRFNKGESLLFPSFPAEVNAEWQGYYDRALRGESFSVEKNTRFRAEPRLVEYHFSPIRSATGEIQGATIYERDVTERRQVEEALRESEDHLKQAHQLARIGHWDFYVATNQLQWSEEVFEIFGQNPAEFQPSVADFDTTIHPDDRQRVVALREAALRNNEDVNVEYRIIRSNGGVCYVYMHTRNILDGQGNLVRVTGTVQDITERRQADEKLRQVNERFILASRAADLGVWDWNVPKNELLWDEGMYKLYDAKQEDFAEAYQAWLNNIHPDDRARCDEAVQQALRGEKEYDIEFRILRKDGTVRDIKALGQVIRNDQGEPLRMTGVNYDITERKRTEAALQKSEELYRLLFSGMTEGFALHELIFDENGEPYDYRFLDINPAFERLTGLKREDLIGRGQREVLPTEDPFWFNTYCKVALTGESIHLENYSQPLQKYYEVNAYSPAPNQFAVIFKDITERKQAEQHLQHYLSELKVLYENGLAISTLREPHEIGRKIIETLLNNLSWHHIAIRLKRDDTDDLDLVAFDQSGLNEQKVVEEEKRLNMLVNKVGQGLSGWAIQTGQAIRTGDVRAHPQYIDTYSDIRSGMYMPLIVGERVIGGIAVESEKENAFTEQDERLLATLAAQTAIAFENARLYQNVQQELKARMQVEESLRESEERWRRAIADSPIPIMIHDEDDQVLQISAGWTKFSGYTLEDIPTATAWTELAYGERKGPRKEYINHLFSIDKTVNNGEWIVNAKDGSKRIWAFQTTPLGRMNKGKRVLHSMALDITERKRAEEEVDQLNANLEQRVKERTAQLEEAQEQLVRQGKLAVLGQMAGSVGHELRNPLGVMSNAIYFLKMVQTDASDKVKEYLNLIEKNIRISDKIVGDLLDFTRIKSVDRAQVPVPQAIQQTLERFPVPGSVQVTLKFPTDLPADALQAYADVQHVVQILGNFTLNACQVMEAKGGQLTISSGIQAEMIFIAVQDTGGGILPENMKKLFEPLFTTKPKGIGLGLAVSKKLAEANGGRIEVHSEVGAGSTFTLYLPIYRRPA